MKVFQFTNSFITVDGIRSVLIYPERDTSGVIRQQESSQRWIMKVIYKDDGIFRAYFDNEHSARKIYLKLMSVIQDIRDEEHRFRSVAGWSVKGSGE